MRESMSYTICISKTWRLNNPETKGGTKHYCIIYFLMILCCMYRLMSCPVDFGEVSSITRKEQVHISTTTYDAIFGSMLLRNNT